MIGFFEKMLTIKSPIQSFDYYIISGKSLPQFRAKSTFFVVLYVLKVLFCAKLTKEKAAFNLKGQRR